MKTELIDNIKFEGVDMRDWPEMTDAYIISADYNGRPMTEFELDEINEDRDFVYEELLKYLQ